jgi:hypothetical protein
MNGTIISEEKLLELKDLARKIEKLESDIFFGDRTDHTLLSHRKLTEQLTELILKIQ